jgi:type II secretory pathway pseudopilin PulG
MNALLRTPPRSALAVTLVEVLVVIGVVGALLAIATPAIMGARRSAGDAASLLNIRQCFLLIEASADDRDGEAPVKPAGGDGPAPSDYARFEFADGTFFATHYFMQAWHWPAILIESGLEPSRVWFRPGSSEEADPAALGLAKVANAASDYVLSQSYMAEQAYWRRGAGQSQEQWRPMRLPETRSPARKGLLFESSRSVLDRRRGGDADRIARPIAFADGHADLRRFADAKAPVRNTLFQGVQSPVLTTEDGSDGADY